MREHVIYYFSGTGNSLRAALSIQKALGNCRVAPMEAQATVVSGMSSVGLVFPCYFGDLPRRVNQFIADLSFSDTETPYVYAVVTYGGAAGTVLNQLSDALNNQGIDLSYAAVLKTFANNVILYDMSDKVAEKTAQTKLDIQPIIADICEQKSVKIKKPSILAVAYNRIGGGEDLTHDQNYRVSAACTSCGICIRVCPVDNISLEAGKPRWQGHCEQCLACLHWCPERAIDYGEKTKTRGRYTNPEITSKMFISYQDGEPADQ